jgi:hypothetical protein
MMKGIRHNSGRAPNENRSGTFSIRVTVDLDVEFRAHKDRDINEIDINQDLLVVIHEMLREKGLPVVEGESVDGDAELIDDHGDGVEVLIDGFVQEVGLSDLTGEDLDGRFTPIG